MINLIKNELIKVKMSKIIITYILYLIILLLMKKYSDKSIIDLSFNMIPIIGIFICLLFGGIISNEIDKGTFRYYLTKPVSRYKVYLSKILIIFIYCYISVIWILFISSIILNKIDLAYFSKYFTYSIPLFLLSSIMIYLSNKFKNTSFTICLGVLLFSFSLLFFQLLLKIHFSFIEYTFLPYLDFSLFDNKNNLIMINQNYDINLSLKRGVLINTIYIIIFFISGCISFMKRDIKS